MKSERGFSLVELMVAMTVGLIIVLGAGQLLLSVFSTHRQVETLGEKQAAVNFAVDTLIRDIRKACWKETEPEDGEGESDTLVLNLPDDNGCASDMVEVTYTLDGQAGGETGRHSLTVDQGDGAGAQEVVSGLTANGFRVNPVGSYGMTVTLELVPTKSGGVPDTLTFFAINRTEAVGE